MNWLQRYVDNVKAHLPGNLREDVGSELYSTLQDQCDDMAESLGRQPGEEEVLALLKEKGHPMQVAAAYQPRRTLVSEALFPLYTLALQWMLAAVASVNAIAVVLSLFGEPEADFIAAVIHWLAATFNGALHGFAWVTLAFYLAGKSIRYSDFFGQWNPRKLPEIIQGNRRINRFNTAVELVALLVLAAWLNDLLTTVAPAGAEVSRVVFSTELKALLPWLNTAIGLSVLMAASKLIRPYWTRRQLLVDTAISLCWLGLYAALFNLPQVFTVHGPDGRQWEIPLQHWRIFLFVAIAITVYDLARSARAYLSAPRGGH